ncbi:hypothetical protein [Brachybacterium sp. GU-2]|nr:hypothetical protein [Brachybacterium sp. GU-2]WME22628.1 hypothetical protein RBL05_14005 [Brachybacterium sp. GU-2]
MSSHDSAQVPDAPAAWRTRPERPDDAPTPRGEIAYPPAFGV